MAAAKISRIVFLTYAIAPAENSSIISISRLRVVKSLPSSFRKPIFKKCHSTPLKAATAQPKNVYPDPIPEFAEAETLKFKAELLKKLSKDEEEFGGDLHEVANVCSEIFREFLHKEYGGPGTLLVEPFTDMLVALKKKRLPGAPVAARASLLWAQNYVDQDWEEWNSKANK